MPISGDIEIKSTMKLISYDMVAASKGMKSKILHKKFTKGSQ